MGAFAVAFMLVFGCGSERGNEAGRADAAATVSSHAAAAVSWEPGWTEAFTRAEDEDKPVLVTFYADWCVWCKRLDTTTFRDEKVAAALARSFIPLRLDVEGAGRERSAELGVASLPTTLVLDPQGRELGRIDGYVPPAEFLDRLTGLTATAG